jgi:hypothetical protein
MGALAAAYGQLIGIAGHQHMLLDIAQVNGAIRTNQKTCLAPCASKVRYNSAYTNPHAHESGQSMTTETITIRVDARAAQAFKMASDEDRRKLEALLSLRLLEAAQTTEPLEQLMRRISVHAQQRGLTPDILQDILDESE